MTFEFVQSMRRLASVVALGLGLGLVAGAPASAQQLDLPDFTPIVEKVDPGVVNIRTTASIRVSGRGPGGGSDPYELFRWFFGPDLMPGMPNPGRRGPAPGPDSDGEERTVPRGLGSGFFISSDGYILTNHHVIDGADGIRVTLSDGREFDAELVGSDQRTDVALLKVDIRNAPALKVGNPKKLRKGDWVLAFGSPFGLESTVTAGIVSAIGRDTGDYLPFIQTDVAVNPGNSGGPLVNLNGEVVGINSQIVSRSGGFMGISLAIPIDEAMLVADQLKATGKVTRGRIGVQIGEVSDEVAKALGLDRARGALVSSVERDGPAAKAGVEPGDVVLEYNGVEVKRVSDLPRLVGASKPGSKAKIKVWRRGKALDLTVTVGRLEAEPAGTAASGKDKTPDTAGMNKLGLKVADLSSADQQALGVRGGVRVEAIDPRTAPTGIAVGDVILGVNDVEIENARQFDEVVSKLDRSRTNALLVRRGDLTQWVPVRPSR